MWQIITKVVGAVFGMGGSYSVANNAGGLLTHAVALPALYYFAKHYNDVYPVQVPLWVAGVLGVCGYVGLETLRRKLPGAQ